MNNSVSCNTEARTEVNVLHDTELFIKNKYNII